MQNEKGSFSFDNFNLLIYIVRKIKPLAITTFAAMILSVVVALLIPVKYESSVVLLPPQYALAAKSTLNMAVVDRSVSVFGETEDVESMMQVLTSEELMFRVADKLQLLKYYGIEGNSANPMYDLRKRFGGEVKIRRTNYNGAMIRVRDTDPEMAVTIASTIATQFDTLMNQIILERNKEVLQMIEKKYASFDQHVSLLEDSLDQLRKLGVLDYQLQVERLTQAYGVALAEGRDVKRIEEKLNNLAKYGGGYASLWTQLETDKERISELKADMFALQASVEEYTPQSYIVDRARPADKKAYPVRWLIVLFTTVMSFITALVVMLLIEYFKGVFRNQPVDGK